MCISVLNLFYRGGGGPIAYSKGNKVFKGSKVFKGGGGGGGPNAYSYRNL